MKCFEFFFSSHSHDDDDCNVGIKKCIYVDIGIQYYTTIYK